MNKTTRLHRSRPSSRSSSRAAAQASSHMDAPLITLDPAANTTDVYAFVSTDQRAEVSHRRAGRVSL